MAEQTEAELETLRRVNGELVAKNDKRKQRIAELEAANVALEGKLNDASASIHRLTIDTPLRRMSEDLAGDASELFIEQLTKYYNVALVDGKLALHDKDNKPVMDEGNVVPWEREPLKTFLAKGDDTRAKTFRHILVGSKASGAAHPATFARRTEQPRTLVAKFGIR